jgi:hypothetical protein
VLGGEALGAFSDKVDVRALAQDFSGGADGVGNALNSADSASTQGGTFHDEGVQLHFAVTIQEAAAAGVESLVVFEYDDGFFDRVKRGPTFLQCKPTSCDGVADAVEVGVHHVVGDGPGAAVNN